MKMKKMLNFVFSSLGLLLGCKKEILGLLEDSGFVHDKAVRLLRVVFLSMGAIGFGLLLAGWGIIFLPLAIVYHAPWDAATKILFSLAVGLLYFLLAYLLFALNFSKKAWVKRLE